MRYIVEKHLGEGDFERVGVANVEVSAGDNPVPPAFEQVDIQEHADYRSVPPGPRSAASV